jgi:hypothetical protein
MPSSSPLLPALTPLLATLLVVGGALPANDVRAEVTRFEILTREPFAGGQSFGETGPYERIVGRVHYALDPQRPQNGEVVDLSFAPRNDQGLVEFSGDLFILAPQDPRRGNGAIFYDVNNRGNKLALRFFNEANGNNDPKTVQDAGNGFLMKEGFTVVWSGWDGELIPGDDRLRLAPPVARKPDQPVTGLVRCEIVPDEDTTRTGVSRANHGSYRPTAQGLATATLTHRQLTADPRQPIPRDQWRLHVVEVNSDSPNQLPVVELELPGGLRKGQIYELIYEAQDPLVHGTCFTALRDLITALKHGTGDGNPLLVEGQPAVTRAYGFGVSQSGRFLREFLYWGFNQDEQGRRVFEGLMPHVSGAGLGSFNHRFAQPTRHGAQHDHHDYPSDRFPFAYESQHDPLSDQTDGILRRSRQSDTEPLVLHTQSVSEYWNRSGSLTHTDPLGTMDAKIPGNVRIYFFGGTQHGPSGYPPSRGKGQTLANPGDYKPFLRCLLLAMDRWSRGGEPAPPSVYPTIEAGTLVDWRQASTGFPEIPGIRYPTVIQQPSLLDFGPRWLSEQIADKQPPTSRGDYRVRVPRCDADGNDVGCLAPPEVAVPVATYTGWNLRTADAGAENQLVTLQGSYIPLPVTNAEREQAKDPRLSLEQRYGSLDAYLEQLEARCQALRQTGYLLADDVPRILAVQRERLAPIFAQIGK